MSEIKIIDYGLAGLTELIKNKNKGVVKIGILGDSNARNDGDSNASIGAKHEFGDDKLPVRSFLRMPLVEKLQKALSDAGALDKETLDALLKKKDKTLWLKKIGIVAEGVIGEAFDTGGFGRWQTSNMKNKKVHQTLVESQQLRDSITSEVET